MNDIANKEDVRTFVDAFYQEVRKDPLIGPVFLGAIPENHWGMHLERMYSFWHTVLFGQRDYQGNPFSKHRHLPIEKEHFDRWIELFSKTIDAHFFGAKTEEAKYRASLMGKLFLSKINHNRSNKNYRNIF